MTVERNALAKRILIPKMRQLVYKRFIKLEKELGNLSQEAIYDFGRFLKEIDYKIIQLEKKSRIIGRRY